MCVQSASLANHGITNSSFMQQISPNYLAAKAVTTTRCVGL